MAFIEELPLVDSPEAFGLHPNADITYQSNMAAEVLESIMNIQPKDSGGGGGETRETLVFRMAGDMLSKLPGDYVPHEVGFSGDLHLTEVFKRPQKIKRNLS